MLSAALATWRLLHLRSLRHSASGLGFQYGTKLLFYSPPDMSNELIWKGALQRNRVNLKFSCSTDRSW